MKQYLRSTVGAMVLASAAVACGEAYADRCTAVAEFLRAYPANEVPSKFKFKFRVSSEDCQRYGCSGYVHYTIHFQYSDGDSNRKSTLVSYRIPAGQEVREVTDETYPSGALMKVQVRDAEIGEVSCTSP
jgi:hypothetical protein